jgi:hypothetical protein
MAWAPPARNTRCTPISLAAASTEAFTAPSRPGGVQMTSSSTPATTAGTEFMMTVDAYDPNPPGTYRPALRTGSRRTPSRWP